MQEVAEEAVRVKGKQKDRQKPLTGRSLELLKAINEAAASFQRSAVSEAAVFQAYQEQMGNLDLRGGLSLLDESGENLVVKIVNYTGRMGRALQRFEKLIGIKTKDFTFPVADVAVYSRAVKTGQTQYIHDSSQVVSQMIPKTAQRYLGRLIVAFGGVPAIYAPIISSEGKIHGVINIAGKGLTQDDVPALTAFANHIGVALDNARLFETLEQNAAQLEARVAERTEELATANERLTELDRLKSRLISNVSHELRTPITTLELYLDLHKRGQPEKRDAYLKIIEEQVHRLRQLVEGILDLSRLDAGGDRLHAAAVQLNDVVAQVILMVQEQASAKGLHLRFVSGENLPTLQGNKSQLSQIVMNLIANSINYTPAGQIDVCTYLSSNGNRICLQIKDTGQGILAVDHPHIFDRFYRGQGNGAQQVPGTGLGLAIVKEIVDIHHGAIEFESEVGLGTTFRVWLPISQA